MGLSGGVDSSTTAALIKAAFDRYNKEKKSDLELVGYILPSSINKTEDAKDAEHSIEQAVGGIQMLDVDVPKLDVG